MMFYCTKLTTSMGGMGLFVATCCTIYQTPKLRYSWTPVQSSQTPLIHRPQSLS